MITAKEIKEELFLLSDPQKRDFLPYFFKTGKGQYGEGDLFIGVVMPKQREIVKKYGGMEFEELSILLNDEYHECRMVALQFLVNMFQKSKDNSLKEAVFNFYINSLSGINNWDLVDLSAPQIVGGFLMDKDKSLLYDFAVNENLWIQRIAVLSTFAFIKKNIFADTLAISRILLHHRHDLIHKAVGWMLREVGKRDLEVELAFLDSLDESTQKPVYSVMPRTMLRYAIEKFPEELRLQYLKGEKQPS